jgi:5-methylcytosine-specific restriction endonuclease McrA
VVTVKSRETKADLRARYWLRNVTAFAPKSPILLYVNCWDNDDGLRVLDEPRLRNEFPNIQKVVYVSAKTAGDGEFRERLMEPLIETAAGTPGCHRRVPRSWKAVRDAIEAESQENNYLTKARCHAICAEYPDIRDENAPALLSYFNSLGVCFSYHRDENKKELADYRLLNPVWLTNAIYAIIEEGMAYAREGRIPVTAVQQMLCNQAPEQVRGERYRRTAPEIVYQPKECPYIIDVAVQHSLCYRVDAGQLFFPALCSTDSPEEALEAPGAGLRTLRYRMKYSYLPDDVLHRLMIRCMKQNFAVKSCWLRGLILADTEDHRVLIRMENDETLGIELWFRPDCPALSIFLWLREEILGIDSALGLDARDFIVDDAEEQYSVVSLIEAAKDGSKVYGQNTGKKQDARALLGDYFESWTIEGMEVRENALVIPILPYKYHRADKNDPRLRRALYEAYNGVCAYCGNPLRNFREMDVDHIFPSKYQERPELAEYVKYLNAHGFDTAKPDYVENYFPAHPSCNRDKSNHTEPFALLAWHHRAARMAPKVLELMGKSEETEDY